MCKKTEKSDEGIVLLKSANKGAEVPAESVEGRASTKRKSRSQSTCRTPGRSCVTQAAERIRQAVTWKPEEQLTALLHHINPETLRESYYALKKDAAAGVDGETWQSYGVGLEDRLNDLHRRVHAGAYRAPPSRRVEIPKSGGGTRPLGIASLEDKVLQKAMVDVVLTPIYEPVFLGFSYGFRPGRKAHDALDALAYGIEKRGVNWIVDADIEAFFDQIDRGRLVRLMERRIGDKRVLRLITKWLHAGVVEGDVVTDSGTGIPQGGIISAIVANVYLHYVLDLWMHRKWRARTAEGEAIIVRYADDFVVGLQYKRDAERFLRDLEKRLATYGLKLHPKKTHLIEFGRFAEANRRKRGEGRPKTFDFLGFRHYCHKTRKGRFTLGRRPMGSRMSRTLRRIKEELRRRMHWGTRDQAKWLGRVLNGWLEYYAVPGSLRFLKQFEHRLKWHWLHVLCRRSQRVRRSTLYLKVIRLMEKVLPPIKIRHDWPNKRFADKYSR